jgi:hypothetical protein
MVMSRWYRHSEVTDPALAEARLIELATVGSGRLLTPEELDVKNRGIFGRTWRQSGEQPGAHDYEMNTALAGRRARFKGFYGGIDGAGVTARNREMTPLMSNLTEAMAMELACQAVVQDFQRPRKERHIFTHVDRSTIPGQLATVEAVLPGKVADLSNVALHQVTIPISTVSGPTRLRISDVTGSSYESVDENWTNADLVIQKVEIWSSNGLVKRISAGEISSQPDFAIEYWHHDGDSGPRGQFEEGIGWVLHENAWVEFSFDLTPWDYEVRLFLGTQMLENNINDAMLAEINLLATDGVEQTPAAQAIKAQIVDLLLQATHRQPSDEEIASMMSVVITSAANAAQRGSWFNSNDDHCQTWNLFPDWETQSLAENDANGMMRGWTALVHAVLTSWGYLHD